MRLYEFASAAEQMALWKLISDSVWASISLQAKQQADALAAKQAKPKSKVPRAARMPKISPPKPAQPVTQPAAKISGFERKDAQIPKSDGATPPADSDGRQA